MIGRESSQSVFSMGLCISGGVSETLKIGFGLLHLGNFLHSVRTKDRF